MPSKLFLIEPSEILEIRMMCGAKNKFMLTDIENREPADQSLMPNLSTVMSEEELVDLVAYLSGLGKQV